MSKRQDNHIFTHAPLNTALFLIVLLFSACQPSVEITASPTMSITQTELAEVTPTPEATKPATATPTEISPTPSCIEIGGEVSTVHFYSNQLQDNLYFDIYLPPCYDVDSDIRYPVVYLLHGLSYHQDQWQRLGLVSTMNELIAADQISPFIAVMPLEATFTPPQTSQFGNALVKDQIPWIDMNYRTLPEKQYRAIAGVSRGAAWAVHLGFEDFEYFSRVGAHSLPLFEADGGRLTAWMIQSPIDELPLFFIDIGRNDQEWKTAEDFANLLDENSIPHEWYLFNGDHTEEYWSSHLEQYLCWYAADW
jgi:enterochelin esterase-like enzyme